MFHADGRAFGFSYDEGSYVESLEQMRDLLSDDLPIEPQLQRWMPVWGAPGL